ncbi:Ig-like domain-containing protein [Eubacterium xylanophilum]|uniref:Ig-like domain-containing protein n=1 Tax=Eubacterium xylanophilum TaxID=39497 RepID=UPI00047B0794|nr:Ig-like domain-containing protein [Eubacterium xylanophilum]
MRKTKLIATATAIAAMSLVGAVVSGDNGAEAKVTVKKVSVTAPSGKTAYIAKGKSVKLTTEVKVKPSTTANKKVSYTSASKKIAKVNSKGKVKGLKVGKTTIKVASAKNSKKRGSIKVVVKKGVVKKVKLDKTALSVKPGSKATLKAKVTASKGAWKKVAWSSSNVKIVKVNKNGTVTGVKAGSATITCMSTDGSNKKAKCKVTVAEDKVSISSIKALSDISMEVKLSKAKAFKTEDFNIFTKNSKSFAYTDSGKREVAYAETKDNLTYNLYFDSSVDGYFWDGQYAKVTIGTGKDQLVKEVYIENVPVDVTMTKDSIRYVDSYRVGYYVDKELSIYSEAAKGSVTYSVSGTMPKGVKAKISKNKSRVTLSGKMEQVEDGTTVVLTGVDEVGNKFTAKYVFLVGDDTHIVAAAVPVKGLSYKKDDPKTYKSESNGTFLFDDCYMTDYSENVGSIIDYEDKIYASGGDGEYEYSYDLSGVPRADTDGTRANIPAGNYVVKATVSDSENPEVKANVDIPFTLVDGKTIKGNVKDLGGGKFDAGGIEFVSNVDSYGDTLQPGTNVDKDGNYSLRVIPDTYKVTVKAGTYHYLGANATSRVEVKSDMTKDLIFPYYRVNVETDIAGAVGYNIMMGYLLLDDLYDQDCMVRNYTNKESEYYGKMVVYLKKGTYSVHEEEGSSVCVNAYGKIKSEELTRTTGEKYTSRTFDETSIIKSGDMDQYKLSGTFNVDGNTTIKLKATPVKID